jgi:hypothetical protein
MGKWTQETHVSIQRIKYHTPTGYVKNTLSSSGLDPTLNTSWI